MPQNILLNTQLEISHFKVTFICKIMWQVIS
jgi:hypothetical protein